MTANVTDVSNARPLHTLTVDDRVRQVQIMVVGIGALGSEVVRLLVLSGFKRILIVDPDHVTPPSKSSSLAFTDAMIGRPKVEALRDHVLRLRPDVEIGICESFIESVRFAEIARSELLLSCVDSVRARLNVARLATLASRPLIDGGISDWTGVVGRYAGADPEVACLACTISQNEAQAEYARLSCSGDGRAGPTTVSLQTTACVVASLMVQEALKLLVASTVTALPPGGQITYSAATASTMTSISTRSTACYNHDGRHEIRYLRSAADDPSALKEAWAASGGSTDVGMYWIRPVVVCDACVSNADAMIGWDFRPQREINALTARSCSHERLRSLSDIDDLPRRQDVREVALDGQLLVVFPRDGAEASFAVFDMTRH